MNDYWRPVPGYRNYEVSRRGEVRSLVRNRLLAQVPGARGYLHVNLYEGGRPRNFLVHRLVATVWLGTIPAGWQVNHKDGNKHNNDLGNLEIVTPEANRLHAVEKGLVPRGEDNPRSVLTEDQVKEIRRRRAAGGLVRHIARDFDVAERTIYLACHRKTWRHVE